MKAGARVDTDKYDKENARDFVLWKAKEDEPAWAQWDAPFGRGRPGWHIECSAMSMKYLGETFDLHCGGVDLIFPHHENEIAQSECGTGKPFVRHWMHVEHLMVDNETMSKSKGNFYTLPDVLARGHRPEAIRYLLLQAHYRSSLNFTWEGLQHAAAALERIHGFAQRLSEVEGAGPAGDAVRQAAQKAAAAFDAALTDDLNTPGGAGRRPPARERGQRAAGGGGGDGRGRGACCARRSRTWTACSPCCCPTEDRLSPEEQALFDARAGGARCGATSPAPTTRASGSRRWASSSRTRRGHAVAEEALSGLLAPPARAALRAPRARPWPAGTSRTRATGSWPGTSAAARERSTWWRATATSPSSWR